jgi:hypothetical protein
LKIILEFEIPKLKQSFENELLPAAGELFVKLFNIFEGVSFLNFRIKS